jgi:ABC-type branched-subunit amino acid transport system ATPase component
MGGAALHLDLFEQPGEQFRPRAASAQIVGRRTAATRTAGTALLVSGPPGSGKTTLIRTVLGQVQARAGGFLTDAIKRRPEVGLYRLSVRNGNDLAEAIAARLHTELGLLSPEQREVSA